MRSPRIISLLLIVGLAAFAMPNAAASSCTSGNFNEVQQCPGELSGDAMDVAEFAVATAVGVANEGVDIAQTTAHDLVVFAGEADQVVTDTVEFALLKAEETRLWVENFLEP